MGETKNVEQKASGALKPVGWLCVECGTYHDHDKKPDGCKPCESLGEAGDWQPLWGRDAMVRISVATMVTPPPPGEALSVWADSLVTHATGCRDD